MLDSDISDKLTTATMDAPLVFEKLLKQVMDSFLNYKLEMSAFSAVIFLNTSFTRDKSGMPIFPSSSTPALSAKLVPEESENHKLKQRLSQLEAAYEEESCNLKIQEMNSGTLPIV